MNGNCGSCKFWSDPVAYSKGSPMREGFKYCRRFPPKAFLFAEGLGSIYPATRAESSCGEFKPAINDAGVTNLDDQEAES
jgi:hypothetical protein